MPDLALLLLCLTFCNHPFLYWESQCSASAKIVVQVYNKCVPESESNYLESQNERAH
jgi:hypothetical protein